MEEYLRLHGEELRIDQRPQVLSCNWNTVQVFLLLSNQWERIGLAGVFHGIPTERVESTLSLSGLSLTPREYFGLRLMEAAAKPILNDALKAD